MNKKEVKKLIKHYVEENLELKLVHIDNKYNLWLAINECGIPYQIYVDYEDIAFNITELSTMYLHSSCVYKYYYNMGFVRL